MENIYMVRGDTLFFTLEIEDLDTDLTSAYFSCKKNKNDTEYVFQKSLGDGIEKTSTTTTGRTYKVIVDADDTKDLDEGHYYYDLQIAVDDYVFTPIIGLLKIDMDVTNVDSPTPSH